MANSEPAANENPKASLEKQADLLYDHYKESINTQSALVGKRIRVVVLIMITLALMIFQGTDPDSANSLAAQYINQAAGGKGLSEKLNIDPRFISSLMWCLLATLTVQTYGYSLLIELQSNYLKHLEKGLDGYLEQPLISRYRAQRPAYLRHANFLYVQVFLGQVGMVVLGKIYLEMREVPAGDFRTAVFTLFDAVMAGVIFYYSFRFIKDFRGLGKTQV